MTPVDVQPRGRPSADDARRLAECADRIRVRDVMTRDPITVTPEDSVTAAYERVTAAGIHHLPVVEATGRPVALLDAQTLAETWPTSPHEDRGRNVRQLLPFRRPDCVLESASIRVTAVDMYLGGGDAVCVVDADGRLVGLVTARDLVAVMAGRLEEAGGT